MTKETPFFVRRRVRAQHPKIGQTVHVPNDSRETGGNGGEYGFRLSRICRKTARLRHRGPADSGGSDRKPRHRGHRRAQAFKPLRCGGAFQRRIPKGARHDSVRAEPGSRLRRGMPVRRLAGVRDGIPARAVRPARRQRRPVRAASDPGRAPAGRHGEGRGNKGRCLRRIAFAYRTVSD